MRPSPGRCCGTAAAPRVSAISFGSSGQGENGTAAEAAVPWSDGSGLHAASAPRRRRGAGSSRSEEHTSELQSHSDLVCRLLLEKKKKYPFSKDLTKVRTMRNGTSFMLFQILSQAWHPMNT